MTLHAKPADKFGQLREQVNRLLKDQPEGAPHPAIDVFSLIHDLEVYQMKLEAQKIELKRIHQEASSLQQEYEDLYEFAPCGYLTLNANRIITRINLAGAKLLGGERQTLLGTVFSQYIEPDGEAAYLDAQKTAVKTGEAQCVEIPLIEKTESRVWVRLAIKADLTINDTVAGWRMMLADITARMQAEEALIESRALLQSVINCADVAIYAKDAAGRFILSNRYHADLLNSTPSQTMGKANNDFEILAPYAQAYEDNDQRVWQTGDAEEFEEIVPQSDGDHIYLSRKFPLRGVDGNIRAMCGISTDITERKRAEEELEQRVRERTANLTESEAKYRGLVENTLDIPCSLDAKGTLRYVAPQAKRYGFDPNELVGCRILDLIFPDDREQVAAAFNKSLVRGKTSPIEFRILAPGGSIHWFEVRSTLQRDSLGHITGFISVLRDVTERKRSEQVLRESEERYRSLFEAESDAILVFDAKTRAFVDVNPAAEKLYGYTHDEFLNLKHRDITAEPEASEESITQAMMGALKEQIPLRRHYKKDGSVFAAEISHGKFTLDGRMVLCGIVRDITARRQAEIQRDKQQQRLRRLAARLAKSQDEEQRRIAEGLHDDVAQDLALCSLKLALADREEDPTKASTIRDEIDDLIKKTAQKVRSLSFELFSSTLYRVGFKEAILELCDSMSMRYDIRLKVECNDHFRKPEDPIAVVLFKAVRELLFNVVKHSGVREATVSIFDDDKRLKLMVEDRGTGFHHNVNGNVLDPGKGFGLFGISERLRDLGGGLWIESTPGVRTRVILQVPVE